MPPPVAIFRFRRLRRDGSALRSVLPESHQSSGSAWEAGAQGNAATKNCLKIRVHSRTRLPHADASEAGTYTIMRTEEAQGGTFMSPSHKHVRSECLAVREVLNRVGNK